VTHVHGHDSVVVTDNEGPATALIVLIGIVIVGALIWFLAFSGVVFNRGGSSNTPDVNIQNPPAQQNNTNTNQQPSPAQS
jgi:hypothetical protein